MKDNLSALLRVRNLANGDAALYFYGEIVSDWWEAWSAADKYPEAIRRMLDGLSDEHLHIYINSPGGSVFAGMAIYNMLSRYKGRKTVHIDGIAASIASVIAMVGDVIEMPENTMLMIHRAWVTVSGNTEELARYAELLSQVDDAMMSVYSARLNGADAVTRVAELMSRESYLSAAETAALFRGVSVKPPLEMAARVKNAGAIYNASLEYERLKLLEMKTIGG